MASRRSSSVMLCSLIASGFSFPLSTNLTCSSLKEPPKPKSEWKEITAISLCNSTKVALMSYAVLAAAFPPSRSALDSTTKVANTSLKWLFFRGYITYQSQRDGEVDDQYGNFFTVYCKRVYGWKIHCAGQKAYPQGRVIRANR